MTQIKPNIWGPHFWKVIHYIAMSYPENPSVYDKEYYKNFYKSIQYVLPCSNCKSHMQENLKSIPIENYLNNNKDLFKWTVDLHNNVNKVNGKQEISYQNAYKIYSNNMTSNNTKKENLILYGIIAIIFLIIVKKYLVKFFMK